MKYPPLYDCINPKFRAWIRGKAFPFFFHALGGKDVYDSENLIERGITLEVRSGEASIMHVPEVQDGNSTDEAVLPGYDLRFGKRYVCRFDYSAYGDCLRDFGCITLPGMVALQTGEESTLPRVAALSKGIFRRRVRRENLIIAGWPHLWMTYGDFLPSWIPRVARILRSLNDKERAEVCVALPLKGKEWAREMLEFIGIDRERQIDTLSEECGITRSGTVLTAYTESSCHFLGHPEDWNDLYAILPEAWRSKLKAPRVPTRRLMIQRGGTRKLLNEKELFASILDFGFEFIEDTYRSIPEQIELFMDAECVVQPHGAAYGNLIWAYHPLRYMEVIPSCWMDTGARNLCAQRGNRYQVMVDRSYGELRKAWKGGFVPFVSVDPLKFKAQVDSLLS